MAGVCTLSDGPTRTLIASHLDSTRFLSFVLTWRTRLSKSLSNNGIGSNEDSKPWRPMKLSPSENADLVEVWVLKRGSEKEKSAPR